MQFSFLRKTTQQIQILSTSDWPTSFVVFFSAAIFRAAHSICLSDSLAPIMKFPDRDHAEKRLSTVKCQPRIQRYIELGVFDQETVNVSGVKWTSF